MFREVGLGLLGQMQLVTLGVVGPEGTRPVHLIQRTPAVDIGSAVHLFLGLLGRSKQNR